MKVTVLLLYLHIFLFTGTLGQVSKFNVKWNTLSKHSMESMPLGNGDIGINLWADTAGIHFYIGKTDAWSGNGRLLKPGKVTIRSPYFENIRTFSQELMLDKGEITMAFISDSLKCNARVWVDANYPVIRVELEGDRDFSCKVELQTWRNKARTITDPDYMHSAYGLIGSPDPVIVEPDKVVENSEHNVIWYHRNNKSIFPLNLKIQGLGGLAEKYHDPLLNRSFGGLIKGSGLISQNKNTLISDTSLSVYNLSVYLFTNQAKCAEDWITGINELSSKDSINIEERRTEHQKWWHSFWNRSWIELQGDTNAFIVSRGYALQRFLTACAGRGDYPVKFNGSIFTVDPRPIGMNFDADYRRWGGCYWFQNTRLIYYPMLMSGDMDMLFPLFDMYMNAVPIQREATQKRFGHEGTYIGETVHFWGTYNNNNWGWENNGILPENNWIKRDYNGTIELLGIMLDYYDYTLDSAFAEDYLVPYASEAIAFFDNHYRRDENGKLYIHPAQSLETWWTATNPTPNIAALRFILPRLTDLPGNLLDSQQKENWQSLYNELPEIPLGTEGGKNVILPAETYADRNNSENPELYTIFPYRLYGMGKDSLSLAKQTFAMRDVKGTGGWRQDAIQAALIGNVNLAKEYIISNYSSRGEGCRFPGFYGPNFDWIPDQDHGNVACIALQRMIMQTEGKKILLLPAWPSDWDAQFKLHAPMNTIVEGTIENGTITTLNLTPESRLQDVEIMNPLQINQSVANHNLTCFPNPFSNELAISFFLNSASTVNISIYDLQGKLVCQITDKKFSSGKHQVKWQKNQTLEGNKFYLVNMKSKDLSIVQKVIYIK